MNILAAALQRYAVKAYDPARIMPEQTMHQLYELLLKGVLGAFSFNEPKVRNASHVVRLGAAALGVYAEFGLAAQGVASVAMVCFGYRSPDDANGRLPKSRLSQAQVFTFV